MRTQKTHTRMPLSRLLLHYFLFRSFLCGVSPLTRTRSSLACPIPCVLATPVSACGACGRGIRIHHALPEFGTFVSTSTQAVY